MIKRGSFRLLIFFLGTLIFSLSACTVQETRRERKSCLDCHAELAERFVTGVIHQPLKSGRCEDCHRPHGLVGGVYLKAPQPELCFKCHQGLAKTMADYETANRHQPAATGKCALCHSPHNAPFGHLLSLENEQVCYQCHQAEKFEQQYRHPPLADGCQTCHQAHGGEFPGLLPVAQIDLCRRCHDLEETGFRNKHGDYPVTAGCLSCHDVHSATDPNLLKPVLHQPVADLDCTTCHLEKTSSTPFSLKGEGSTLCRDCHDVEEMANRDTTAHQPVIDGNCLECHSPHASNFRGMTRLSTERLCYSCHEFERVEVGPKKITMKRKGGSVHPPLLEGDCLACHNAHLSSKGRADLLRDDGNKLCSNCHEDVGKVDSRTPCAGGQRRLPHLPRAP